MSNSPSSITRKQISVLGFSKPVSSPTKSATKKPPIQYECLVANPTGGYTFETTTNNVVDNQPEKTLKLVLEESDDEETATNINDDYDDLEEPINAAPVKTAPPSIKAFAKSKQTKQQSKPSANNSKSSLSLFRTQQTIHKPNNEHVKPRMEAVTVIPTSKAKTMASAEQNISLQLSNNSIPSSQEDEFGFPLLKVNKKSKPSFVKPTSKEAPVDKDYVPYDPFSRIQHKKKLKQLQQGTKDTMTTVDNNESTNQNLKRSLSDNNNNQKSDSTVLSNSAKRAVSANSILQRIDDHAKSVLSHSNRPATRATTSIKQSINLADSPDDCVITGQRWSDRKRKKLASSIE